jgi:hypothetical protein
MDKQVALAFLKNYIAKKYVNQLAKVKDLEYEYKKLMEKEQELQNAETNYDHAYQDVYGNN